MTRPATGADQPHITVLTQLEQATRTAVGRLSQEVFHDQADPNAWEELWQTHSRRPGFTVALANYPDSEQPVGFCYGYVGHSGQWWTDQARKTLPADVAERWLGGHNEIVSLSVHPDSRQHGIGRSLLQAVVGAHPDRRAVLMTVADPNDPAHRLYRSEGWQVLGTGLRPNTIVMGLERGSQSAASAVTHPLGDHEGTVA